LRETAGRALSLAITGLEGETGLLGDTSFAVDGLRSFAEERGIPLES
jgi:hypothetical protein